MSFFDSIDNLIMYMIYGKGELPPLDITQITPSPLLYRPLSFDDYIGQDKAKAIISSFIAGSKRYDKIFPHTMIYGNAGCGKTTLARIIAGELQVPFIELLATDMAIEEFLSHIQEVNGGIIFLDESHRMKRETVEQLHSVMEDFMWNGQYIPHFTLIGATTEIGEIIKNRKPFYDRFKIIIELEDYTTQNMLQIIKKYVIESYKNEPLRIKALKLIAENSRLTPRKSIRLADYLYYSGKSIIQVFQDNQIIDKGYTTKDLKVLEYLQKSGKAVGLDTLSLYLDIPQVTYNYDIEPYLVKTGLIQRTAKGRIITQCGINELNNLKLKMGI